jgi:hypothetical protein
MCDGFSGMRLCTCDGKEIDENSMWILYSHQHIRKVGLYLPPLKKPITDKVNFDNFLKILFKKVKNLFVLNHSNPPSVVYPKTAISMEQELNLGSVFDFAYKPENDDVLVILFEGQQYVFKQKLSIRTIDGKMVNFRFWKITDFKTYIDKQALEELAFELRTRLDANAWDDGKINVLKGEICI